MSGAACVIIISSEALKLKAPSPMLENCLRQLFANPLVLDRISKEPWLDAVVQLGVQPQWSESDQKYVQALMRDIASTDMPDIELP